jgi:truncated hemoglobin YjbI
MSEVNELKEATRRAHEAIKDLKLAIREAQETSDEIKQMIHDEIYDRVDAEVAAGLDDYKTVLSEAIDKATDKVFARFDYLADILMGEDKQSQRKGKKSITELLSKSGMTDEQKGDWLRRNVEAMQANKDENEHH